MDALTFDNTVFDTEWTLDTGASNHMTSIAYMLKNMHPYLGTDSVLIRNATSLEIKYVGDATVNNETQVLHLNNVASISLI